MAHKRKKCKIVIFVGAHPDDIELGCSGAIAKYINDGFKIICIFLSKGGKGGIPSDGPDVRVRR